MNVSAAPNVMVVAIVSFAIIAMIVSGVSIAGCLGFV